MSVINSAVYIGDVYHQRFKPVSHGFKYSIFMMYLDLDELDDVLLLSFLWSKKAGSAAQFRRSDYFGDNDKPLKRCVQKKVNAELGMDLSGRVCMLTNLRYFGYIVNPLTVYYCFDVNENLCALLLEVTNTPWGEREQYVLKCDPEGTLCQKKFKKTMHVSPFHPMSMIYQWQSNTPSEVLKVDMKNWIEDDCVFDAKLNLKKRAITTGSLNKIILTYPYMTLKIVVMIYWQALRLWIKKVPYYPNPKKANKRKGEFNGNK